MRKVILGVLAILLLLVSCSVPTEHKHTFSVQWSGDETYHWYAATCGHEEIMNKSEHAWGSGVVSTEATHSTDGVKTYTCTVCKRTKTEVVSASDEAHSFSSEWTSDNSCHWHLATCGHAVILGKTGHTFVGDICGVCGYDKHIHSFSVSWAYDASGHWHAATCGHNVTKDKTEHAFDGDVCKVCGYDKHIHVYSNTWTSDDIYHWHVATCGHDVINGKGMHSFGSSMVVDEPTCTSVGVCNHTCNICGKTVVLNVPKTQHIPNAEHVCTVCGNFVPYIGPSGGYVFYDKGLYSDGWRYLEAAPADLRVVDGIPTIDTTVSGYAKAQAGYPFGYYRKSVNDSYMGGYYVNGTVSYDASNCTGTAIGTGKNNTQLLVNAMGASTYYYHNVSSSSKTGNYAARLCSILSYTVNYVTYDDWFLPSKDELYLLFQNLHEAGLGSFSIGDDTWYWSSSERPQDINAGYIWQIRFTSGDQVVYYSRDHWSLIRPIRVF